MNVCDIYNFLIVAYFVSLNIIAELNWTHSFIFYILAHLVSTLLVAKYIRNFGRKTMYFLSAIATIVFEVAFGVVDYLDLGAR